MQKYGLRYINMLQENQVLLAHSMISLKNNLYALSVQEEETRNIICNLAQRTLERFEKLENRVDQLEVSTNLNGWIITLEDCEYDEKYPTEYIRLFKIINDFYAIKNDNWVYRDLQFMRTALRIAKLDPKKKITLNIFIDKLVDEIQNENVGFNKYKEIISINKPKGVEKYSQFVAENISSPLFLSIHHLNIQYLDKLEVVEELQDEMNLTIEEALKRLLRRSILNLNVNLDYEFPMAEAAIEILGAIRLTEKLILNKEVYSEENNTRKDVEIKDKDNLDNDIIIKNAIENNDSHSNSTDNSSEPSLIDNGEWKIAKLPDNVFRINGIKFDQEQNKFLCVFSYEDTYNSGKYDVFYTSNFQDWEFISSIKASRDIRLLYIINNTIILICGDSCYDYSILFSYDKKNFQEKRLISDYNRCKFRDIYHFDNKWYIFCTANKSIGYTEKGIIFDSQKSKQINVGLVYEGSAIEDLTLRTTSSSLPRNYIKSISYDPVTKKYISISFYNDHNGGFSENILKESDDLINWYDVDFIDVRHFSTPILKFINNKCILVEAYNYSHQLPYIVDFREKVFTRVQKDFKVLTLNNSADDISNTILFGYNTFNVPMFVSNDLNSFKRITFPVLSNNKIQLCWSNIDIANKKFSEYLASDNSYLLWMKEYVPSFNENDPDFFEILKNTKPEIKFQHDEIYELYHTHIWGVNNPYRFSDISKTLHGYTYENNFLILWGTDTFDNDMQASQRGETLDKYAGSPIILYCNIS